MKEYSFVDELKYFHSILNLSILSDEEKDYNNNIKLLGGDRSSIFNKVYHNFVDNNSIFNEVYYNFINKYIKPLYSMNGKKIVVQKTPNLRISLPNLTAIGKHSYENENDNVIGLHKDADFGHHEDEINVIVPITKMFDTNSIYYEPYIESNISTDNYLNLNLDTDEFFIEKFNKLRHFNKINNTNVTRMSLDFRIIPYEKYMNNLDFFKDTKFEIGKYYILI
jgi:hypothetical protein